MLLCMRTSIVVEDGLFRAAKEAAAQTGRTFTSLVDEGLRRVLAARESRIAEPLDDLPTHRGAGVREGVDLTNNAAVADVMDGLA